MFACLFSVRFLEHLQYYYKQNAFKSLEFCLFHSLECIENEINAI